jgi:hypothetical protein
MVMECNETKNIDLRSLFEPKIKELNEIANEISNSKEKDKLGYVVTGISKLTSMMLDCEQFDTNMEPDEEAYLTEKVVKVNRYVNNKMLDYHGVDRVVVGGMFMTVPVYFLPAKKLEKAIKNKFRSVLDPEKFGLPGTDVVDYATYKYVSPTVYMALAKFEGNYANELITTARNYDYVYLK